MTGCEREGAGLPRVCFVEKKNGLLTPSTRCLHTGQWAVLQPISPSKASSGVNTSRGVRNGRTGDGTRLADSSVFPRAQPDGLGSVGNGHLGPFGVCVGPHSQIGAACGAAGEERSCCNWWECNRHVVQQ